MIAVLCVFIVYIGLYMNKKKDWITQESRMELSSFLLRQAEMTYLPVFSKYLPVTGDVPPVTGLREMPWN